MPYENEHAVLVHNPDKYIRIKRQNDRFGKGISVLWGVLKHKIGNAKTEIQAIRFDAKKFTVEDVKQWLYEHGGIRGMKVEPAYATNPTITIRPKILEAWLRKMYREEKDGVKEYERAYHHIGKSTLKTKLGKIIKDEKQHVHLIEGFLK